MPRRGHRPTFGSDRKARLLEDMGNVREAAIICGAAAGYNSPRHAKCDAVRKAIDTLAGELTGDAQYYWIKMGRERGSGEASVREIHHSCASDHPATIATTA